jgi:hypothetical protein
MSRDGSARCGAAGEFLAKRNLQEAPPDICFASFGSFSQAASGGGRSSSGK